MCLLWCRALSAYQAFTTLLALILTALIVFVIANSFPIVKIEPYGQHIRNHFTGRRVGNVSLR
ncbi:paraquat-inducible protein A [Acinetobacter baumannii]